MKAKTDNDKKKRHLEFLRLFDTVPRKSRVEKIRWVAEKLDRRENTVRIYLMKNPTRVPTALILRVLEAEIRASCK